MRRNRRGLLGVVVLLAAAVLTFYFYSRAEHSDQERYLTEETARGDSTMSVIATGSISAVTTVQVGSQVSGIISRLYANFNSRVKKEQLLAELDPTPFEETLQQRRADLA